MIQILASGDWRAAAVKVEWTADSRPRVPRVEAAIDSAWRQATARPGIHLFDGPMCRLESFAASAHSLHLQLSPTSYKVFFGTNMSNAQLADEFGREVLANPVGLSAALISADGFLLLGRRNASVAYYPNRVHPFAGALEPRDGSDVFAAIGRELAEELSLGPQDVRDTRCVGLVEDPALRQPELIFRVESRLTRDQIERQLDAAEHRSCLAASTAPAELIKLLQDPTLTPVATGLVRLLLT